jgi:iron complex outermembrane recepter protein
MNPKNHPTLFSRVLFVLLSIGIAWTAHASQAGTGEIRGRVVNEATGDYLGSVRITVEGTSIETITNSFGEFRLPAVPAGEAVVLANHAGLGTRRETVIVVPGQTVHVAHSLGLRIMSEHASAPVALEPYSVQASMVSAEALALAEQRNAPNIKNVISPGEFVDTADGNIGEFIRFVPGVEILYNPTNAGAVFLRGMPASGTLVLMDGSPTAPAINGNVRAFDLNTAANANIERIEVSKVPTPDMPANAVGGMINVVSKSGFSRSTPLFTYNLYTTYNALGGKFSPSLSKRPGPDHVSAERHVQLAYELSYILPLRKDMAFTFSAGRAPRYNPSEFHTPTWNHQTLQQVSYIANAYISHVDLQTAKGTFDWRPGTDNTIQFSYNLTDRKSYTRQNRFVYNMGANTTGDHTFVQGNASGVGSLQRTSAANHQNRFLELGSMRFKHDGRIGLIDGHLSYSRGRFALSDMDHGVFSGMTSTLSNLVIQADGLGGIKKREMPVVAARDRSGQPVDVLGIGNYTLASVSSAPTDVRNEVTSGGLNFHKQLQGRFPINVKTGVYTEKMSRTRTADSKTYTFTPPGGATGRLVGSHDLVAREFSDYHYFDTTGGTRFKPDFLSFDRMFGLYKANPSWFVLNESAAYINSVNSEIEIDETITAAYLRGDRKFVDNRLWVMAGVRYEHTATDGLGPKDDVGATFSRDANGQFLRSATGALIPVSTNALETARLRYTRLAVRQKASYDGLYPSVNSSFAITNDLLVRAAYARTIGRPDLHQIIPSTVITAPTDAGTGRITVVNSGLEPWSANNYDLTVEAYNIKNVVASASWFYKDIKNFFASTSTPVTPEILNSLQLSEEYLNYIYVTSRNAGSAAVSGFELSYQHTLTFIPVIGRNLRIFGNLTRLSLSGPNAGVFTEFSNKNVNGGISYVHKRFVTKFAFSHHGWVRRDNAAASATTLPGSYQWRAPATKYDISAEYRFHRRFSLYGSVRNLTSEPMKTSVANEVTPAFAKPRNYQFVPAMYTLGVKGSF